MILIIWFFYSINNTVHKFHFWSTNQMVRSQVLFDSTRTIWLGNQKLNECSVLFIVYQPKTSVYISYQVHFSSYQVHFSVGSFEWQNQRLGAAVSFQFLDQFKFTILRLININISEVSKLILSSNNEIFYHFWCKKRNMWEK